MKNLSILVLLSSITACGYIPVRNSFEISGLNYSKPSIEGEVISLMVWNIHKEVDEPNWQREFKDKISDKKPNIVLLQEVRLNNKLRSLFRDDLNYGWVFSPNTYQGKFDAYSGVLTASQVKPSFIDSALSNGLEPFTSTPKSTVFTKYKIGNTQLNLLVINVHGINFQISLDKFKEQLRFIVEKAKKHEGPIIMAGDFNTWNMRRIGHINSLVKELGLKGVMFGEQQADYVKKMFGNPLDHIFYSQSYLRQEKNSVKVFNKLKSSDHKALFVKFSVRQP